ncbi:hypothetical protein ACU3L3_07270 [Priestia endophytica]
MDKTIIKDNVHTIVDMFKTKDKELNFNSPEFDNIAKGLMIYTHALIQSELSEPMKEQCSEEFKAYMRGVRQSNLTSITHKSFDEISFLY